MNTQSVKDKVTRAFFSFETQLENCPNIYQCENPEFDLAGEKNILAFNVGFESATYVKDEDIGLLPYTQTSSVYSPPRDPNVDVNEAATKYLNITLSDITRLIANLNALDGVTVHDETLFSAGEGDGPDDGVITYWGDLYIDEDVQEPTLHQALALIVAFLKKA